MWAAAKGETIGDGSRPQSSESRIVTGDLFGFAFGTPQRAFGWKLALYCFPFYSDRPDRRRFLSPFTFSFPFFFSLLHSLSLSLSLSLISLFLSNSLDSVILRRRFAAHFTGDCELLRLPIIFSEAHSVASLKRAA
ncbi:hypothetical protein RIF29_36727 [Crotalaria pallida]|uniref:Transmembrane protein n=1 Tax=Crotalaria pallida TaxID=3830 RepID=A0AAN9HVY0_CROPI